MVSQKTKIKFPSELRFDLVSGDWVVIATGRSKRPEMFKKERSKEEKSSKKNCPFCQFNTKESVFVIPNKFPAFLPAKGPWEEKSEAHGLYKTRNAVGYCELVVTKNHEKSLALLSLADIKKVLDFYQKRYLDLMDKSRVNYISIFHNQGKAAGASIYHPHSQIITAPLIDADLKRTLSNSRNYFKKTHRCVFCQMNAAEKKLKKRIIFEDKYFLAICPFASKAAFEIIISPKAHSPYFENITPAQKISLAKVFKVSLSKLYKGLNNPAYNFYLHTAPCDGKQYPYYHWHWTILPKTAAWAGFELGARMEISTIAPENAAEYLREITR